MQEEQQSKPLGKTYSFLTDIPKIQWDIIDFDKGDEAKIHVLKLGDAASLLEIDVCDIPHGMAIIDWIDVLLENGIVLKETTSGRNNKDESVSDTDNA